MNIVEKFDEIMSEFEGKQSVHAVSHKKAWNQSGANSGAISITINGYKYSFSSTACTKSGSLKKAVAKRAANLTEVANYDWLVDRGYILDCVAA